MLFDAALGLAFLAVATALCYGLERWAARKREKERERKEIRHITGSRMWWKHPPGDPPEGDY